MNFRETEISGAYIIDVAQYADDRGIFQEHYNKSKYDNRVSECKQISFSKSNKNVVRGIHCSPHGKLIQCIRGKIIDTVFDFRMSSPTYMKTFQVELSEHDSVQLFVPAGCGHGFLACEDNTTVLYAHEGCYDKDQEMNVNIFDPIFNVACLTKDRSEYIMSEADKNAPFLVEAILIKAYKNQSHT